MSSYVKEPFLEKSEDIILVKDNEHKIVAFNETFSLVAGIKRKDLIGLNDYDMLWKEDAEIYINHERDIISGKEYQVIEPLRGTANFILHTKKLPIFNQLGYRVGTYARASFVKNDLAIYEHLGGRANVLKVMNYPNGEKTLTIMESKLVYLLMRGFTRKKMAEILKVSVKSIDFHQDNIKKKLNINSSREIIFYCLDKGWGNYFPFVFKT